MPGWTWEQLAAFRDADRTYTRTWAKAMRAFDREDDLRQAMNAYNVIMGPACQRWNAESAAAVALGEEPF